MSGKGWLVYDPVLSWPRHSGCVLQSLLIQGRAMADGQYVQLSPYHVMPPAQWRCNCASHGGPRHSTFVESAVERAAEANHQQQEAVSFATDPCHGLFCKRRCTRVMRRHDSIRDSLVCTLELELFKYVQWSHVCHPQTGADLRRGDIRCTRVAPHGSLTWASGAPGPSATSTWSARPPPGAQPRLTRQSRRQSTSSIAHTDWLAGPYVNELTTLGRSDQDTHTCARTCY
jgi:hypothetical protein